MNLSSRPVSAPKPAKLTSTILRVRMASRNGKLLSLCPMTFQISRHSESCHIRSRIGAA